MSQKIYHPRIRQATLLIQAEMYYPSGTKHFALVSSYMKPKYTKYGDFETFELKKVWGKKPVLHHYILWGNTNDFNTMGITQCLTEKLNACKGGVPMKRFMEIIKAAEYVNFSK
jgi:hypothetical protein